MRQKFYSLFSWCYHKLLCRPHYMKVRYDNKLKNPKLTVVMLHGISSDSNTWHVTYNQFSKKKEFENVRFIAMDLLGFGKSPRGDYLDYDYLDYNTSIDLTLKRLKVKSPIVLIGHSMGSLIAAEFATNYRHEHNIIRMILVSPPVLMSEEMAKLPDKVYMSTYRSLHKMAEEIPAVEVIANIGEHLSHFKNYLKTKAFAKSMENIILNPNNYHTYTRIKIPTLIVHGSFDPLVAGTNLRRVAKNNSMVRFTSVIAHHDITSNKRIKIYNELKKGLRDAEAI